MYDMSIILRYWRDLSKSQKQGIMSKYGIQVMTYEKIKITYNENIKK